MKQVEHLQTHHAQTQLRSPEIVMRLQRMGSFFPSRLSFMRSLIRRMAAEQAQLTKVRWEMDEEGYGRAVYSISLGGFVYSLVAFSTRLDPQNRTDRVIAEAWDSSYVLYDGVPDESELNRLEAAAPKQEAARFTEADLILSRANKSVRLFDHVAGRLAAGNQPDEELLASIGYLMRTTAVYGNGKFGISDRGKIAGRPGLSGPFQAEMLTVWMIRNFTHDLVEYVAKSKSPDTAVGLDKRLKKHLGIGNATGLGMAPFLVSHPVLLNNWILVRETALARICALEYAQSANKTRFRALLLRAIAHVNQWSVTDDRQQKRIALLRKELPTIDKKFDLNFLSAKNPWQSMIVELEAFSFECQELIISLLIELHGELVDGLTDCMASDLEPRLDPAMTLSRLRQIIAENYSWALERDYSAKDHSKRFWYVSEEKLEPRLGDRFEEEGAALELPLDIARQVKALTIDLSTAEDGQVARFLMRFAQHRHIVRRIQTSAHCPYSEIRDNLIGEECLPIDMLRCKLSFFGASKFDPKSDRWTRITLYQGGPLASDFNDLAVGKNTPEQLDDWWLPVLDHQQSYAQPI